jgi:hypothetical protein
MRFVQRVLVLGLGLVLSACELSAPPATGSSSCQAFSPCGGNVVGTWSLKSVCTKSTPTDAACTVQSTGSLTLGPGYKATYNFNADGTFAASVNGSVTQTYSYPGPSCSHSDASPSQYCGDLGHTIQMAYEAAVDAGTLTSGKSMGVTCTPSGSEVCKCEESLTYTPYTVGGTYTTSGYSITVVVTSFSLFGDGGIASGSSNSTPYCVSGNRLTLGPAPGSPDQAVVVFTKGT